MAWAAQPTGKRGRQPIYSDAAVQTCLTMKVLFGMALRQTTGFVESLLCLIGLDWESPKAPAAINFLVQHGWLVALDPQAVVRGIARKEAWRIVRPGNVV